MMPCFVFFARMNRFGSFVAAENAQAMRSSHRFEICELGRSRPKSSHTSFYIVLHISIVLKVLLPSGRMYLVSHRDGAVTEVQSRLD
jgi:hypothetical protein